MATSAIVRLQRVLELEERQGWRNRAVIGGLQAMATRWADDARAEGVDATLLERTRSLMQRYGSEGAEERPDTVALLRRLLAGDPQALAESEAAAAAPVPPPAPLPERTEAARRPPPVQTTEDTPPEMALGATYVYEYREAATPGEADGALPDGGVPDAAEADAAAGPPPAPSDGATAARPAQPRPRSSNRPARKRQDLEAAPTLLQGVGPSINEQLRRLGIERVADLLWHLPARHEDFTQLKTIADLRPGEQATVVANLWQVNERNVGINKKLLEGVLTDSTGTLTARFWNRWALRGINTGTTLRLSGKVGLFMGKKTLDNPVVEDADSEALAAGRLAPVYPLTEGLSQKKVRQLTRQALEDFVHFVTDPLPEELRRRYNLMDLTDALWGVHFPDSQAQLEAARRRLAFEELFYVQLGVLQRRRTLREATAPALVADEAMLDAFAAALPFPLTGAQRRVLREVAQDLAHPIPMTRLVQGDVGSGKTAVAAGAMYVVVQSGRQAAMLAPTQILAEQHHRGINRLLGGLTQPDGEPIEVALLTGRVTGAERERVLAGLRDGSINVVVGTTALIQGNVEFEDLALAVVDEQHRFGVEQRGALRTKADKQPHVLVMSATPIPRSLALTVFGDLDLSILDEMPPGRTPIRTVLFRPTERERVYGFVRREAQAGRQAFIVYPLVEESALLEAGAATQEHERLQREVFPDLRVALLHGQMKGADKDTIMTAFAAGESDVLVSTSVIEVGIDVPNASVILIEDAERFGLAQLHQFRGRVGRGQHKSFCVLVSRAEGDASEERLRVLESTTDGFVLAEKDLEMRGPGEFLGKRQSGLPELRMAQLSDLPTLTMAREAAQGYFAQDPELTRDPLVAQQVARFWRGEGDIS